MGETISQDSRKCAELMCRCCTRLCRVMNSILAKTGVNMAQCQTMSVLSEHGEMTMSALTGELGVTMGAGTNVVDKLVDASLVTRRHSESDRRIVKVKLTEKGNDTLKRDTESLATFWSAVMEKVSPEKRTRFLEVYDEMLQFAEEARGF